MKPYTYLPFGGGKRSCIGGAMSQVENTLALSMLLRRFRPEYVGTEPPGINATVTLTPKGGLQVQDPRAELVPHRHSFTQAPPQRAPSSWMGAMAATVSGERGSAA